MTASVSSTNWADGPPLPNSMMSPGSRVFWRMRSQLTKVPLRLLRSRSTYLPSLYVMSACSADTMISSRENMTR